MSNLSYINMIDWMFGLFIVILCGLTINGIIKNILTSFAVCCLGIFFVLLILIYIFLLAV
jgi:hypothetical protein